MFGVNLAKIRFVEGGGRIVIGHPVILMYTTFVSNVFEIVGALI